MVRNALIAAGNSGQAGLVPRVAALLDDPAPVVRGAAVWALARLDPDQAEAERARRAADEMNESVRAEWTELGRPEIRADVISV
jgi:epoxyqueuosine reductase